MLKEEAMEVQHLPGQLNFKIPEPSSQLHPKFARENPPPMSVDLSLSYEINLLSSLELPDLLSREDEAKNKKTAPQAPEEENIAGAFFREEVVSKVYWAQILYYAKEGSQILQKGKALQLPLGGIDYLGLSPDTHEV
ncbi:hypothetical protein VNO77_34065 [Canavalia gladiata]|uniref:Uncharacterized protein n=1 Tax=Canavalia gladiata TaxID=3824 RepID=A0AAN9PWY3_CANGL